MYASCLAYCLRQNRWILMALRKHSFSYRTLLANLPIAFRMTAMALNLRY